MPRLLTRGKRHRMGAVEPTVATTWFDHKRIDSARSSSSGIFAAMEPGGPPAASGRVTREAEEDWGLGRTASKVGRLITNVGRLAELRRFFLILNGQAPCFASRNLYPACACLIGAKKRQPHQFIIGLHCLSLGAMLCRNSRLGIFDLNHTLNLCVLTASPPGEDRGT